MGDADKADGRSAGRRSRRDVIAGASGALGLLAAETVVRAAPARAAQGQPVIEGADNTGATGRTGVFTAGNKEWGILADPNASKQGSLGVYGFGQDVGVRGEADRSGIGGTGVYGLGAGGGSGVVGISGKDAAFGVHGVGGGGNATGVRGLGFGSGFGVLGNGGSHNGPGVVGVGAGTGSGVRGFGGANGGTGVAGFGSLENGGAGPGVLGQGSGTGPGVLGIGGSGGAAGVQGSGSGTGAGVAGRGGNGGGPGVHGSATSSAGVGVLADNPFEGTALEINGRAVFSRSGTASIAAGSSSVTVPGMALSAASLVLATLQQDRVGIYVRSAVPDPAARSFTVHLNESVTVRTTVAWFVVN